MLKPRTLQCFAPRGLGAGLALCCAMASFGLAHAEKVGTAVVNGRTVVLDGNGTWQYEDAISGDQVNNCETVKGVEVCVKKEGWREVPKQGRFQVLYTLSDQYYFGILVEPFGLKDGITYDGIQVGIIGNAAGGGQTTPANIPVLATEKEVNGYKDVRSITYLVSIAGMPLVFHNAFKVYNDKSVQFVFWTVGKKMSDDFRPLIDRTLKTIKLD